jgi:hypothetical protein
MTLLYAHLADAIIVSREGKLSIIGIFQSLHPPALPFLMPRMELVLGIGLERHDSSNRQVICARVIDPDAQELHQAQINIDVPTILTQTQELQVSLGLTLVTFSKFGPHSLEVYINDDLVLTRPIEVSNKPIPNG